MMRTGGSTYEDLSLAAARLFLTIVHSCNILAPFIFKQGIYCMYLEILTEPSPIPSSNCVLSPVIGYYSQQQ